MKNLHKRGFKPFVAGILVVTMAACGIYPGTSRSPLPSPLPTPTMTPTPLGFVEPTRTPTPTSTVAGYSDPTTTTPEPTWTPTITPVVVNMAGALPEMFTYMFVVERANGRREVYYVPVGHVPMVRTESDRAIYEAYVQSQFNLGPDDVFVGGCALSPLTFMVPPQMVCTRPMQPPSQPPEMLTATPTP